MTLPLPATQYLYKYRITYGEDSGKETVEVEDPDNPAAKNGDSSAGWSQVYVGNAETALEGMEYIYSRQDGKTGSVVYTEYESLDGSMQPLGIYIPYGYDPEKTYKTIYISHGSGGNETEWMSIGSVPNIMDNLGVSGELNDTIVVTMDNSIWTMPDNPWISGWDWEKMNENILNCIVPYMEENYIWKKIIVYLQIQMIGRFADCPWDPSGLLPLFSSGRMDLDIMDAFPAPIMVLT